MKILVVVTALAAAAAAPFALQDPQGMPQAGPEHVVLMDHVGVWDAVVITEDMEGKEQRSKGKATTRKLADFHTIDDFEAEFMGMQFVGHGMNSWCPLRRKYVSSWADSMTPSPLQLTGDYDAKTRQLKMSGECLGMSGKLEPCRTVTYLRDADHFAWEMFGNGPDGKEMRTLRIEYTRHK